MYDYRLLTASEQAVRDEVSRTLGGVADAYPKIIEVLLSIPQLLVRKDRDTELREHAYYFSTQYLQTPFTVRCVYDCFEKGYFLEALILMRHLLEAFVQMRYFRRHLNQLDAHITSDKRISFKRMFDEFVPGFYSKYYGKQVSEAAHGIAFKFFFRLQGPLTPYGGAALLGNRFDVSFATYIINNLNAIVSGYFNKLDELLPWNLVRDKPRNRNRFDKARAWLNSSLDKLEQTKTEPSEVFEHYRRLFRQ